MSESSNTNRVYMFFYYNKMKSDKWRLYKVFSQSTTCWRGCNEKTACVRDFDNKIINFATKEEAIKYSKTRFGSIPFDGPG